MDNQGKGLHYLQEKLAKNTKALVQLSVYLETMVFSCQTVQGVDLAASSNVSYSSSSQLSATKAYREVSMDASTALCKNGQPGGDLREKMLYQALY